MGCAGWKLTSAVPWGNNVSVTSHLLTKGICQLRTQQWYRSYRRYLWPSKWQRQLFLLTCFMSSCDGFKCKNIFTSYEGLCWCIIWPSFLFDCFVKIWATCENFWANGSPSPLAKNCPYAYAHTSQYYRIYSIKRPTSNESPPRISAHPQGRKS